MEFRVLTQAEKSQYEAILLEILTINDKAFIPPLSQRSSTTQKNLLETSGAANIRPYFDKMMEQNILAFFHAGALIGYVSYIDDYICDGIGPETHPNIYLSTLVLRPESRGMGVTRQAYAHLFLERCPECNVYTRTWSTNAPHIKILSGFGFAELKRLPNDRGEGIDTVYYFKRREK